MVAYPRSSHPRSPQPNQKSARVPPPASPRARVEETRSTAPPTSLDREEGALPAGINPWSSDASSSPHGFSGLSMFRLTWRITWLLRECWAYLNGISRGVGAEILMFPAEAETTRPDWELLRLGSTALPRFLAPSHPPEWDTLSSPWHCPPLADTLRAFCTLSFLLIFTAAFHGRLIMGFPVPGNNRTLLSPYPPDPPSLHPPPPSLGIHGLCTPRPLSPGNFAHLGLGLENFLRLCFSPCPRLPLATTRARVRDGNAPWAAGPPRTHRCSRSVQGPGALADALSRRKRPGGSWPCASGGTRWLHSPHFARGTGIPAGIWRNVKP